MYVCVYIRVCINTCAYCYVCMCIYTCVYKNDVMYVCVYMQLSYGQMYPYIRIHTKLYVCMYHSFLYRHQHVQPTLKSSWIPAGVEPGNQEGHGYQDLGRVLVLNQNTRVVQINGTNQTNEGFRGRKPAAKKILVRLVYTECCVFICIWTYLRMYAHTYVPVYMYVLLACALIPAFVKSTVPLHRDRSTGLKQIYVARHCNTLQHTATHCNTLQHTATHCNTLKQIYVARPASSFDLCIVYFDY